MNDSPRGRAVCAATVIPLLTMSLLPLAACAERSAPPPLNGRYDLFVDFAKQTFNGMPTPMVSRTFPVDYTTRCYAGGCVVVLDNSGDRARNPGAPATYEYRWKNGRWETSGPYPYFCDRMNPDSAVKSIRTDYLIPNSDGSFSGERTLAVEAPGCPGEGPGVHRLPTKVTPAGPRTP